MTELPFKVRDVFTEGMNNVINHSIFQRRQHSDINNETGQNTEQFNERTNERTKETNEIISGEITSIFFF